MMATYLTVISVVCIVVGLIGLLWNAFLMRREASAPGFFESSQTVGAKNAADKRDDRVLYDRAIALVRENRSVDGARILEELGLCREAAAVLERAGLVHEAAAVFLRRKRYHRAGEVYARHKMYSSAGHCYLLAAGTLPSGSPGPKLAPDYHEGLNIHGLKIHGLNIEGSHRDEQRNLNFGPTAEYSK